MTKKKRHPASAILKGLVYLSAIITFLIIVIIMWDILSQGLPQIVREIGYLINGEDSLFSPTYTSDNLSMVPAVINTLVMVVVSLLISSILGIGSAIYLVEYAKSGSKLVKFIRVTAETLSGIPSIVYGLFGSLFFVKFLGMGMSLIAGILTASIMILPTIIRSTEEALKSVPMSYREASYGLGTAKLRTIMGVVLPSATNGILAGIILSIGRVVGETAALIFTSGTTSGVAENIFTDGGRTLAVHMYILTSEGVAHFPQAYATAAVLLIVVVLINWLSSLVAGKLTKG